MIHFIRRLPPNMQAAALAVSLIAIAAGVFLMLR